MPARDPRALPVLHGQTPSCLLDEHQTCVAGSLVWSLSPFTPFTAAPDLFRPGAAPLLQLPGKTYLNLTTLLQYLGGDEKYSTFVLSFWQVRRCLGTITDTLYRKPYI